MTLRMQGLLLRFLETGEIQKVGADRTGNRVDVRTIAATNRNLRELIAQGLFREDLFYRLNVIHLMVPPLRDRKEDVRALIEHFLGRMARPGANTPRQIAPEAMTMMLEYHWPGNVRELQNVIERGVVLCEGDTFSIDESWLRPAPEHPAPAPLRLAATLVDREKELIEAALAESRGRVSGPSGAAARLGIPRQTLDSKISTLRIDKLRFRPR